MDKVIRSVNEKLWREAKAQAFFEGKSVKNLIEEMIIQALSHPMAVDWDQLEKYTKEEEVNRTKIIRDIDEQLWRKVKVQAPLDNRSIKEWVEGVIANALSSCNKKTIVAPTGKQEKRKKENTKILRSINEMLWREAKAFAALEGKTMKDWVESVIAAKIKRGKAAKPKPLLKDKEYLGIEKTKILRNIDEQLWRKAKAQAALEGLPMKEWVEGCIAEAVTSREGSPLENA